MIFNLRSKITRKILNFFFLNDKSRVYVNEIARQIEEEPKNVYRILIRLEDSGILTSEFSGRERYFTANLKSSLLKEYKTIFMKTSGIESMLKKAVTKRPEIKEAFIYGSYASGKYKPGSDIDLLLVGNHKSMDAQKMIFDLQKTSGSEINVINITPENFNNKKTEKDQLISSIFSGKVIKLL
ncbi:MAG: nucleotidyltransferase domain-containing protein [Elusimicrobia bacterium]|nr:nucleotidyltransferase domain-containing protein [Candidatus Liberimonas magnetica]